MTAPAPIVRDFKRYNYAHLCHARISPGFVRSRELSSVRSRQFSIRLAFYPDSPFLVPFLPLIPLPLLPSRPSFVPLFIDVQGGSWLKAERQSGVSDRKLVFRHACNATLSSCDTLLSDFWYYRKRKKDLPWLPAEITEKDKERERERKRESRQSACSRNVYYEWRISSILEFNRRSIIQHL